MAFHWKCWRAVNDQQEGRKARHSSKSWMKTTVEPSPDQWELIATRESSIPSLKVCSSIPQQLPFSSPSPWKQIYTWKGGGSLGLDHPTDLLIKGTGAGFTQWLSTIKLNSLKMWHEVQLMMGIRWLNCNDLWVLTLCRCSQMWGRLQAMGKMCDLK